MEDPEHLRELKKARLDEDVGNDSMDEGAGNDAMQVEASAVHADGGPQAELPSFGDGLAEAEAPQPGPSSPAQLGGGLAEAEAPQPEPSSPAQLGDGPAEAEAPQPGPSSPAQGSAVVAEHADAGAPAPTRKKVYSSPEQLLAKLSPPGCTMGLSFMDHRFTCRFPSSSGLLDGQYKQHTFTRAFYSRRSWREALSEVHRYSWTNWGILKGTLPLPSGQVAQEPGLIPPDILEDMARVVKTLPEVRRY